jgi:hypothetical protein
MAKVRDWLIVISIFLIAMVVGGMIRLRSLRSVEPIANATRIMPFTAAADVPTNWAYDWLDQRTLLVHETRADYAINVPTGKRLRLPGMAKILAKYHGAGVTTGPSIRRRGSCAVAEAR